MKRILFMGVPAFGHTNPTLLLVQRLIESGHQVRYYTVSPFRDTLEQLGAEVVCYDDVLPYATLEHTNSPVHDQREHFPILLALIAEAIGDIIEVFFDEIRHYQPDVIIGDSLAFWASVIAERLGVSYVSFSTHFAFNEHTPTMLTASSIKGNIKSLLQLPDILKSYNKIKQTGYPTKHITDLSLTRQDCPVIVSTSRQFQPQGDTFGANVHFVGPIVRESSSSLVKTERPLIYISLGTVNNQASDFYRNCFKALGEKPMEVLLSVGNRTNITQLGQIPHNFTVAHTVDQIAVLKSADVFLTHCGLNSTSEALYYQVPLLVFPQTVEQNIVADRVLDRGAGVRLHQTTPETIAQGIEQVLHTPAYKAAATTISEEFKASGGVEAAMNIILQESL